MNAMLLEQLALDSFAQPSEWCSCGDGVLEATDIFCGAGGSSLGLEHVRCPRCGGRLIQITQALNHWDLAVEAHNANFPDADHDVHDVELVPAARFRRTPLLWASPGCGHHAYCRGPKSNDDDAIRSRATFNDIVRFTAHHRYDAVIVENVVEARLWCDTRAHGKKCNCGSHFNAWFAAMLELGYEGRIIYFNSQFALPTPQSRDRLYIVFWRRGVRTPQLDFRPTSWCSTCETIVAGVQTWKRPSPRSLRDRPGFFEWGRYGQQYIYTCPGCGDQVAPAVTGSKTAIDWALPAERIGERDKPLADKTRERIKTGLQRLATNQPVTVQVGGNLYERPGYARVWSVEDPLRTVTGTSYMGVVVRAGGQAYGTGKGTEEPFQTILGSDRQMAIVVPGKSDTVPTAASEPMGAITGRPHLGLVTPAGGQEAAARPLEEPMHTVLGNDRLGVVVQNMEHNVGRELGEPLPPVTTGGNHMLVQVARGTKSAGENRTREVERPMPTVAGHGELGLVEFRGQHGSVRPTDVPAHTVTAQGNHHGLLVYNGTPGFVRGVDEPAGVVTTRDKQSLLVPYYTTGVARCVDRPMGAVTGKDRELLVITDDEIDACAFRMLQWQELLRAQMMHAHPDGRAYQLTAQRRNKRGKLVELSNELRVKMIGNAVSSPVATMLGHAVAEALR